MCFVLIWNADVVLRTHNGSSESQLGIGESCSSAEVHSPPQHSLPWCQICIVSFHIFSFILHCLIKCSLTNGWEALFSFFPLITEDGGMWGRLPSIGSKGQNHNHHTSTLLSRAPPTPKIQTPTQTAEEHKWFKCMKTPVKCWLIQKRSC